MIDQAGGLREIGARFLFGSDSIRTDSELIV